MIYLTLINIAIFQGIILGLIIFKSPLFNSKSNRYLACAIFTLSILLLNLVLDIGGAYESLPFLRLIDDVEWAFLLPVFLFLFIIQRVDRTLKDQNKIGLLFFPFGFSAVINITSDLDNVFGFYKIPPLGLKILEVLSEIEIFLALTFIPLLLLYSYRFLKYSKNLQEKKWLTTLWIIFSVLLFSWVIALILALFFQYDVTYIMRSLALFGTFLIHWTTYIGIFKFKLANDQPGIYNFLNKEIVTSDNSLLLNDYTIKEEIKESITPDNLYFQKLEFLCREQHIYTDSMLTREVIAEKLGISAGYVSQIVNTITEDNFANYINKYRIEAVKEMILNSEYENYNLLTIGLEAGFTSKTTFYKAFKKVTGLTPNEYRNANK
ncbi:helix-turn-helix domain-containing protein [Flavobacterium artemisiae]|uniref:Helix-turn-helix domain-containing protein n=1 Tax=Flavobacterium artemisiae TaxID=2126556 RepID=A0ABW4HHI4_9FLAO